MKKEHKKFYNHSRGADSLWNRTQYQKISSPHNLKQVLGLEDEGPGSIQDPPPIKMTDIIDTMIADFEAAKGKETGDKDVKDDTDIEEG